jgi:hypothetical protein
MTQAFLECTCPPDYLAVAGQHQDGCSHAGIDAAITCNPASTNPGCCHQDHDHAAAANACSGAHDDEPCPEPGSCRTWQGATADAHHPLFEPGTHPLFSGATVPDCPGAHCAKGVRNCTVCRPLIITVMRGSTVIQPAGA